MKNILSIGLIVLAIFTFTTQTEAAGITLFDAEKTDYVIVLSNDAQPIEKTAAKELKLHLDEITGFDWKVETEKNVSPDSPQIVVGVSDRAKKLFPKVDFESIKYDGIIIETEGNNLLLAGHKQRGALYAVYSFLENSLGVRWWTSAEKFVPKISTVKIEPQHVAYSPKLIYREAYYKDAFEPIFATRMKCNGSGEPITAEYGGHHRFVYFVHSFFPLIPPAKYFAEHPEWFSEINGKRTDKSSQLCLTNGEMRKELTKNAIESLRKNPDAKFISISQNDWYGYCQCKACTEIAEAEGSQSGPLIQFVNQVAEEIEKEFPDVWVETLAYQYTRKPPKSIKPRKNVVVRLCTIECSFVQPLTGPQNKSLCDDMEGWSKIADQIFVWDYVTNFSSYMIPHPNLRVLAPNIRFFTDHGTIGLFEQGDSYCTVGDFVRLRNWVISHLMWNPNLDEKELAAEFMNGYYGTKATPILFEYFKTLLNKAESTGKHLGCFRESTADWLDYETLCTATELFDLAISETEKEYGQDSPQVARLVRERIPLVHVWLKQYYEFKRYAQTKGIPFGGPADPVAACEEMFKLCEKYNVTAYREYNDASAFAEFKAAMLSRFGKPAPLPEMFKNTPEKDVLDYQEYEFKTVNVYGWSKLTDDATASNNRAATMPGNHREWAVSVPLGTAVAYFDKDDAAKFRVYVFVRCDAKSTEGAAMSFGVYDEATKKGIAHKNMTVPEIVGKDYKMIALDPISIGPEMYIWFAPPERKDEVEAVYIDRIIIVRE